MSPHHVYFADLDNDGDQDAIAGVHAWWQHVAGTSWTNVKAADPGLRNDDLPERRQGALQAREAFGHRRR